MCSNFHALNIWDYMDVPHVTSDLGLGTRVNRPLLQSRKNNLHDSVFFVYKTPAFATRPIINVKNVAPNFPSSWKGCFKYISCKAHLFFTHFEVHIMLVCRIMKHKEMSYFEENNGRE